jgi:hypothetical protein
MISPEKAQTTNCSESAYKLPCSHQTRYTPRTALRLRSNCHVITRQCTNHKLLWVWAQAAVNSPDKVQTTTCCESAHKLHSSHQRKSKHELLWVCAQAVMISPDKVHTTNCFETALKLPCYHKTVHKPRTAVSLRTSWQVLTRQGANNELLWVYVQAAIRLPLLQTHYISGLPAMCSANFSYYCYL